MAAVDTVLGQPLILTNAEKELILKQERSGS
jgi:hypothetical protein